VKLSGDTLIGIGLIIGSSNIIFKNIIKKPIPHKIALPLLILAIIIIFIGAIQKGAFKIG